SHPDPWPDRGRRSRMPRIRVNSKASPRRTGLASPPGARAATVVFIAALLLVQWASTAESQPVTSVASATTGVDVIYYTHDGTHLHPDQATPSDPPIRNAYGTLLGLTWGQWQAATGTSIARCNNDGSTSLSITLDGLIPHGVYSVFYRSFTPDAVNPYCPDSERGQVVANRVNRALGGVPDSRVIANASCHASLN